MSEEALPGRQFELFAPTHEQRAIAFIHTPEGGQVMNRFIRIAIGLKRRGFKNFGAKAIVERLRWHYQIARAEGEDFRINNSYTAYMARYAEENRISSYTTSRENSRPLATAE